MGQERHRRTQAQTSSLKLGAEIRDVFHFSHYFKKAGTCSLQKMHFTRK